jgi:hypothetical protein
MKRPLPLVKLALTVEPPHRHPSLEETTPRPLITFQSLSLFLTSNIDHTCSLVPYQHIATLVCATAASMLIHLQ